ncbi:MAG: FtsX-like permease family protein [Asgard group archaeon]|nr:FtsX-like permease family protein [Asgard group archaeon]
MGLFEERFKLNLKFMSSSRRLAIITIVGLSISIAMVSQNILFLNNFRNTAFNEFSINISNAQIDTQIDNVVWSDITLERFLVSTVENEIENSNMNPSILSYQNWVTFRFFYLILEDQMTSERNYFDTFIVGVNQSYLNFLGPLISEGRAPIAGEYCIVTDTPTIEETNLGINDTFEAYIQIDETSTARDSETLGIGFAGQFLEFAGIINIDDIIFGALPIPTELAGLVNLVLGLGKNLIITNFLNLPSLLQFISLSYGEFSLMGRIGFNLEEFNVFQLDNHIRSLQIFTNNLQESLFDLVNTFAWRRNPEISIYPYILPLLSNFRREYRIFQIFLLAFMLPSLGMSLTLTAFASNQVKKQRNIHIHNFHQRGASRQMLFLFMFFELIIFSILAVLIGFLIGWPYTLVAMKSDNFFSFTKEATIPEIPADINWLVIGICLAIGFAIAWLSNIFSLWRKTKTTVEEVMQERVEGKPFWERFYIDIFFLAVGLLMFIISINQIKSGTTTALEFALYFAAPSPIFIIIGSIMLITRIYPYFIRGVSNIIFKIPKLELSAVSARNAIRRRGSTTRTIILMTLTFALTVASMIIPDSYRAYDVEDSYYELGADIVVEGVEVLNPNYKESIKEIEGIEASSYVSILEVSDTESGLLYSIKIMGVELDNYSKVAYQEPEYTSELGIDALLSSIVEETDVIGQRNQIELLNLGSNNTFTFKNFADINGTVGFVDYTLEIVDLFEYWPTLYERVPQATDKDINIGLIGNLSLPYLVARHDFDVEGKMYIKVKNGYSINEVAQQIELYTRHETSNVEELLLISEGSLKATVLYGALNSSFIVSLLIASATLITMMIVQGLEREREIAILKSFGINTKQMFLFFISEAIIILLFTMIIGIVLGFGTSVMIMKILKIGTTLPQHEMIYPFII